MKVELKEIVDTLINDSKWDAVETIINEYGGEIVDYAYTHPDCPW